MEGVDQLLNNVLGILNSEHLEKYLSTCREHLAFYGQDKKDETSIKSINRLLSDNSDRYGGLTVLRVVLEQCSVDSYTHNACSWLSNSVKATNDKDRNVVNIAFDVLGVLLQMATKFPEIKKFASNNIVPRILEHTTRPINLQTISSLLECLKVCMKEYSGPCGAFKKALTGLLSKLVNSESNLLLQASKCYALLAQIKCSSSPGVSYNSYWKDNQLILVRTLHYHFNRLFSNVPEIQVYEKHDTGKKTCLLGEQVKENSSSVLLKYQLIEKRIQGVCVYLRSMLLGSFPVPKPVLPDDIMGAICRGLAVTCASLGPAKTDSIALGSVLPDVHKHLINLMMDLISLCGRNMIPYGSVICKLVAQELKWTISTEWPYAQDKPYRKLRAVVYRCLRCWLSEGRSAASLETDMKEIISSILLDIKIEKQKVTLKVMKGQGSSSSIHHKTDYASETRSEKLASELANEELCLEALKCLQSILCSYSTKMKVETCKTIQETVLELLYGIQNVHESPPVPYRSSSCRKELYKSLTTLCLETHNEFPPPVTFAVALLNRGLNDPASEVSVLCMSGLSSIEKIIHPSGPPLPGVVQQQSTSLNLQPNQVEENTSTNYIPSAASSTVVNQLVSSESKTSENQSLDESMKSLRNESEEISVEDSAGSVGQVIVAVENESEMDNQSSSNLDPQEHSFIDVETPSCSLLKPQTSESEEMLLDPGLDSESVPTPREEIASTDGIDAPSSSITDLSVGLNSASTEPSKGFKRHVVIDDETPDENMDDQSLKKQKISPNINGINSSSEKENEDDHLTKVNGFSNTDKKSTGDFDESVINDEEMMSCFVDEVTWDKN